MKLEPDDPDAHFVLAVDALEGRTPDVPEARRHLKVLEEKKANLVRRCGSARSSPTHRRLDRHGPQPSRRLRASALAADCPAIERITWLRIITLQIHNETDLAKLSELVADDARHRSKQLTDAHGLAPARVARLRTFLELTQRGLIEGSSKAAATAKDSTTARWRQSSSSSTPSSSLRSRASRNPTCKRS